MTESTVERDIAQALAELHGSWYGRGPSSSKAIVTEDVVVVLLEETFSPAEKGLIERQDADGIREIRRRWQTVMAEELKSIVTQATGRQVRSFSSDTDLEQGLAIEVFVLGQGMEDMGQFEQWE